MSTMTQEQIAAMAAALNECDDDMNEAQAGGGNYGRRLPEGWSVARLVQYIEKGKHITVHQGKAKDPALQFELGFALYSPGYVNEDGTPYIINTFDMTKSRNEKAKAFKWFKAMNYKGLAKNFAGLIGDGHVFLVEIKDYVSKTAAPGTEPKSIVADVRPGIDLINKTEYVCPAVRTEDLFLFSWAMPTLEGWDALFIEGTNDQGKSKNWVQEKIAGATDFRGSALEGLLIQNSRPIPAGTPQKQGVAPAGAQPAGAAPVGAVAPVAPVVPATAPVAAAAPAVAPNVAAASVPATPPAVAPAPAVPSAPVAVTPVAPVAAPAVPVAAVAAPAVAPVVPSVPLAQ